MWQDMHWLVGTARVKLWRMGWPGSFRGIVASAVALWPRLPKADQGPELAGSRSLA